MSEEFKIEIPPKRRSFKNYIQVLGARENNLKNMQANLDEQNKIKYKDDIENNQNHLNNLKGKTSSEWREYATKCMIEILDNKKEV